MSLFSNFPENTLAGYKKGKLKHPVKVIVFEFHLKFQAINLVILKRKHLNTKARKLD